MSSERANSKLKGQTPHWPPLSPFTRSASCWMESGFACFSRRSPCEQLYTREDFSGLFEDRPCH
jgi:hypothetical protein